MAENLRATFNLEEKEGMIKAFNAENGASFPLKNVPADKVIEVVDIVQYEGEIDSYGKDQMVTITVLFGSDGINYSSVSDTIAQACNSLFKLLEQMESVEVKIVKQKSKNDQEFLTMMLV